MLNETHHNSQEMNTSISEKQCKVEMSVPQTGGELTGFTWLNRCSHSVCSQIRYKLNMKNVVHALLVCMQDLVKQRFLLIMYLVFAKFQYFVS